MFKNLLKKIIVQREKIFIKAWRKILLSFYKLIGKRYIKKNILGNPMYLDLKVAGISNGLFINGKREFLETEIVTQELEPNMNILEVGANIGYYAIKEASMLEGGHMYAFEPDPRNIELLQKNIKLNNLEDKIDFFPYAVADKNEKQFFNLTEESNLSSFVGDKQQNSIEVKCVKLDDFEPIKNVDINFLRMDIEGYECKVIDGMKELLARAKNMKIMMEVHPSVYNEEFNFEESLRILTDLGFKIKYLISAGEGIPEKIKEKYPLQKTVHEGIFVRGLFSNIDPIDLKEYLKSEKKIVRAIFLEKKNA